MEKHAVAPATVLVVDDIPDNIQVLSEVLSTDYRVVAAVDGARALHIATGKPRPDIILLDVMMPGMDGFEVCRRLKANPATSGIPVVFVTAKTESVDEQTGFELGAVDYIGKPISPPIVRARVRAQLALYDQSRELERLVKQRTAELETTRHEIIKRLGRAAEYKDNETGLHVVRMSWYCRLLAEQLELDSEWVELLYNASPMHDIGKIGIPDRVLLKPGKLDAGEWQLMQQHAQFGADIMGDDDSALLQMAQEIALCHHEKWDGSGYPRGLKGEEIPLSARITAIADVFDALTSERPYKQAWTVERAVDLLRQESGTHFDPALVPPFIDSLPEVLKIRDAFADSFSERQ